MLLLGKSLPNLPDLLFEWKKNKWKNKWFAKLLAF